jgi:hypothetical protein
MNILALRCFGPAVPLTGAWCAFTAIEGGRTRHPSVLGRNSGHLCANGGATNAPAEANTGSGRPQRALEYSQSMRSPRIALLLGWSALTAASQSIDLTLVRTSGLRGDQLFLLPEELPSRLSQFRIVAPSRRRRNSCRYHGIMPSTGSAVHRRVVGSNPT